MNTPITLQLAKLLKAKGYDKKCYKYFHSNFGEEYEYTLKGSDGELCTNWNIEKNYPQDFISAPTISEVVMWIYEKYGVWISVNLNFKYQIETKKHGILHTKDEFNSLTEAYEAAIEYTLNYLI
jgi:hypothetical protein